MATPARPKKKGPKFSPRVTRVMEYIKGEDLSLEELLELMQNLSQYSSWAYKSSIGNASPGSQRERSRSDMPEQWALSGGNASGGQGRSSRSTSVEARGGEQGQGGRARAGSGEANGSSGGGRGKKNRRRKDTQGDVNLNLNDLANDGVFPMDLHEIRDIFESLEIGDGNGLPTTLVDTPQALDSATNEISRYRVLAVDCEGVRLSRTGELCLMQVATPDEVFIIDIFTLKKQECSLSKALSFIEDRLVMKIVFDCRGDSDSLYHQLNLRLVSALDFQLLDIACRRTTDSFQQATAYRPSLTSVLRDRVESGVLQYHRVQELFETVQKAYPVQPALWADRPLPREFIAYAANGVKFTIPLCKGLFQGLSDKWQKKVIRRSELAVHEWRELPVAQDRRERGNAKAPKM